MNVRMKFLCDYDRCIDCNGCSIACDSGHHLPLDVRRRKVYTFNEGKPGEEYSVSIACMHCTDAPCAQVCPVDCFYIRDDGIVWTDPDTNTLFFISGHFDEDTLIQMAESVKEKS